jgi:hypothetical protein
MLRTKFITTSRSALTNTCPWSPSSGSRRPPTGFVNSSRPEPTCGFRRVPTAVAVGEAGGHNRGTTGLFALIPRMVDDALAPAPVAGDSADLTTAIAPAGDIVREIAREAERILATNAHQ